jgi:pimeloyl-ACP methyl ester carboxylesterase
MLDVMHPMSLRRAGSIHEFEISPLDSVSMREIAAPTLILHARDDKLVSHEHAEFAHRNIEQSELILFETGGHGLLAQVNEVSVQPKTTQKSLLPVNSKSGMLVT